MLAGFEEAEAISARRSASRMLASLDPNGARLLEEAIQIGKQLKGVLAYAEDPCGAEQGFSGREVMAEFRRATPADRHQYDRHRLAADGPYAVATIGGYPAGGPALLTMQGSVRVAQMCHEFGLTGFAL